jgi:hypothetical protein
MKKIRFLNNKLIDGTLYPCKPLFRKLEIPMKSVPNFLLKTVLCICLSAIYVIAPAQNRNANIIYNTVSKLNTNIIAQADSLKTVFEKDGFVVVREAAINMESEYEMPVIMALTEGSWYQFIFIGDPGSSLHEVRMYDWDEKEVVYQRKYGYSEGNVISYSYIPRTSEYHMMKPVQVNKKKKKDLMGYVLLLKKIKTS